MIASVQVIVDQWNQERELRVLLLLAHLLHMAICEKS
jgi:hypothetical protein